MRYAVEFEMQSDLRETVSEAVYRALVSAFGNIDKFKIVPVRAYVGHIHGNQPIVWKEVRPQVSDMNG